MEHKNIIIILTLILVIFFSEFIHYNLSKPIIVEGYNVARARRERRERDARNAEIAAQNQRRQAAINAENERLREIARKKEEARLAEIYRLANIVRLNEIAILVEETIKKDEARLKVVKDEKDKLRLNNRPITAPVNTGIINENDSLIATYLKNTQPVRIPIKDFVNNNIDSTTARMRDLLNEYYFVSQNMSVKEKLLDKYYDSVGKSYASNDALLLQFLKESKMLRTIPNCDAVKCYGTIYSNILGPIVFNSYNSLIEIYPKMIKNTTDYLKLLKIYTSAHNLLDKDYLTMTCEAMDQSVCYKQIGTMIKDIDKNVDYFK